MIERARARHRHCPHLRFERIHGPELPFGDGSFDLVVSFLSFRYLDWDPALREIERVLRPGGRLVVVDMVDKPIALREAPLLVRSSVAHLWTRLRHRRFVDHVKRLTRSTAWHQMLAYNPIRAEHEYRWYLESRFPGRTLQVLSASRTARVVAFDSGPKDGTWRLAPMSFP
jgi:ubiquinone/menaquinone biosynthesis C-methylase UbiE